MDILQHELLNENDECFVLRASLDEPFVYIRFKGIIKTRYVNNELIAYHVQITDILETKEIIQTYMNRQRFRIYNEKRTFNKPFYTFDILNSFNFQQVFNKRYVKTYLDVHSALVFKTEEQMQDYFNIVNQHLINKLSKNVEILKNRSMK